MRRHRHLNCNCAHASSSPPGAGHVAASTNFTHCLTGDLRVDPSNNARRPWGCQLANSERFVQRGFTTNSAFDPTSTSGVHASSVNHDSPNCASTSTGAPRVVPLLRRAA